MQTQLIRIGNHLINPAHIAFVAWKGGVLTVHMAVAEPVPDGTPGHSILTFEDESAARGWAMLCGPQSREYAAYDTTPFVPNQLGGC